MTHLAASLGPSTYWYLSRATGAVALVLLTVSVVLGILGPLRVSGGRRWPRFAIDLMHRDASLLVIVLLVLHIATSVLDGFAPIGWLDGINPFSATYRPLWMGLGAFSFDLLLAIVVTSLLRVRLGYRSWRAVHWLAYLSWPVAVLHGLGTGTDVKTWWMLLLTFGSLAAVVSAVLVRVARSRPVPLLAGRDHPVGHRHLHPGRSAGLGLGAAGRDAGQPVASQHVGERRRRRSGPARGDDQRRGV